MGDNPTPFWKKELFLALVLLIIGLVLLPIGVYWVGGNLAGDYQGDGLWGLFKHIALDLSRGGLFAWALVLSPYLVVQLVRLAVAVFRSGSDVTEVSISE